MWAHHVCKFPPLKTVRYMLRDLKFDVFWFVDHWLLRIHLGPEFRPASDVQNSWWVQTLAATKDNFHYWLICRLFSRWIILSIKNIKYKISKAERDTFKLLLLSSQQSKTPSLTMINDKENQQILTSTSKWLMFLFEKLRRKKKH